MKNGKTPIHIQRWAPADYHDDEHVRVLKARRDWATLTFYRHFIDKSFMAGGSLPADIESLAAAVEMPKMQVERALRNVLGRLVHKIGTRLFQNRVRRDVLKELRYRRGQSAKGSLGGRPRVGKGIPLPSQSPPAPTPTPTPHNETTPPPPLLTKGGEFDFDLPPGLTEENGNGARKVTHPGVAGQVEKARLYAISLGFHPDRRDLRELKGWVKAGRSEEAIRKELDRTKAAGDPIAPAVRPRL